MHSIITSQNLERKKMATKIEPFIHLIRGGRRSNVLILPNRCFRSFHRRSHSLPSSPVWNTSLHLRRSPSPLFSPPPPSSSSSSMSSMTNSSNSDGGPLSNHAFTPTKTERVLIKGRVQGVFYRNWTIENARELGLKGWIRNRRDGSVEALFSGNPNSVHEMEQRCRRGPPAAVVTGFQVFPSDEVPGQGFERKPTI